MPLIARKSGSGDVVNTGHPVCIAPGTIETLSGSSDVFIAGHGAHREGDTNTPHTHCPPVYSTNIVSFSPNVFANGKHMARLNDTYSCGAFVQSVAQSTVFAN
jgi:uncharacterized Zn-binding protein involved in type VI secretion